jgi:hypothetical protein
MACVWGYRGEYRGFFSRADGVWGLLNLGGVCRFL